MGFQLGGTLDVFYKFDIAREYFMLMQNPLPDWCTLPSQANQTLHNGYTTTFSMVEVAEGRGMRTFGK